MVRIRTIIQFITCVCVLLSVASAFEYLEMYHFLGFSCLFLFALFLEHHRVVELPRWLLNGISLGVLALAIFRITLDYLIEPILDALILLVAIKLLEEKKIRDIMQIYTLCLFLLLGSTLISLSASFLLYLSLFLTLVTIALILLAYFSHDPAMVISKENLGKIVHQSFLIFTLSIPLSVVLFVILPRTAYPFLTFLNKAGYARSGFTDTIALGQVAEIQEDSAVIFRAQMERIDEGRLFWRGVVLDRFDGTKWTSTVEAGKEELPPPDGPGETVVQTIYLEPYGNKYLFALDRPISFSVYRNKYSRTPINPFKSKIFERIRYTVTSSIAAGFPQAMVDREHYLQLPADFSPRIKELVRSLVETKPQEEQLKTLFAFLQRGSYVYGLDNLPISGAPLDDFLMVTKRGNCEYFASSLAVMLRMAGIPARLIGGYRGGYYNNAGKYYLVTQQNAHVWVEAYRPGYGWSRLDPTPPLPAASWNRARSSLLLQLRLLLDTFNYYWYRVIIDYDFTKQLEIVNAIREHITQPDRKLHLDLNFAKNYLAGFGLLTALALVLYLLISKHKKREARIIARFVRRMAAYGYEKQPHEGLEEFVHRVGREDLRDRARGFVEDFEQVYYRDREFTGETLQRLRARVKRL
jgi:protein-glutamine gamma-glutamyltransferase